jgi:sec-independent protein translocase protein TatA
MFSSPLQILIVVILVVLLFGRGKISALMGDVAKGIQSFKKGMKDGDDAEQADVAPPQETREAPVVEGEKISEKVED